MKDKQKRLYLLCMERVGTLPMCIVNEPELARLPWFGAGSNRFSAGPFLTFIPTRRGTRSIWYTLNRPDRPVRRTLDKPLIINSLESKKGIHEIED